MNTQAMALARPFVSRGYALVLCCNFLFSFEAAVTEYGVANIATSLHADPIMASASLFWYFLAAAIGVAAAPLIATRIRPEEGLLACVALAACAVLVNSQTPNTAQFAVGRICVGLLQANMGVLLGTLVVHRTDARERARIFGATGAGIGLGYLAAPMALATAIHFTGSWRPAYGAGGVGLLVLLPVLARTMRQEPLFPISKDPIRWIDLLSIASLSALLGSGALLLHPSSPLHEPVWMAAWICLASAGAASVIWTSTRSDNPALDLQLIRHAASGPFLFSGLFSFCATFLIAFVAPYLALYSASSRPEIAALLLVAFPIGFALGSAGIGRVAGAALPGRLAVWTTAGCALASLVGALLIRVDSPAILALAYLASGTLRGATIAPMSTLATLLVPTYRMSSFLSAAAIFRNVGMLVGIGIAAHVWQSSGVETLLAGDVERGAQHAAVADLASRVYVGAAILHAIAAAMLLRYRGTQ